MLRSITWMHAGDRYPDLKGEEHDFIAMDGEIEVGSVKRIEHGAETGSWMCEPRVSRVSCRSG